MHQYASGNHSIQIDQFEPQAGSRHAALIVLHGSGGAASYWMDRFAPALHQAGVSVYAPHYFDKTLTNRASVEMILDGRHFIAWLTAVQDAVSYVASRPTVDAGRIGVLGVSLGGYLAVALGIEDNRIRAIVELSGGVPLGWEDRISPSMPATLILHGANDDVVPVSEARKLQALLDEKQVVHEMEIFPGETHWFMGAAQLKLLTRTAGFLHRRLLGEAPLQRAG